MKTSFPAFFREFWIEQPEAGADRATVHALLDGPSLTGAFRFDIYPANETVVEVTSTLFARRHIEGVGFAPLTSMFLTGELDRKTRDDFRPELHDSDGLLIHSGTGERIWRPIRNPGTQQASGFLLDRLRGFGLLQRDRSFERYQDLDLAYELRPSYWVEPRGEWGDGRVELLELPTTDESNDNIVASFIPRAALEPGRPASIGYRVTSLLENARLSPGGRTVNSFTGPARALGSGEPDLPNARRFIIDFAGGDLAYYIGDPAQVEVVPSASAGTIRRVFVVANTHINGLRAAIDVEVPPGQMSTLRAFLKAGNRALTETWTYSWGGS